MSSLANSEREKKMGTACIIPFTSKNGADQISHLLLDTYAIQSFEQNQFLVRIGKQLTWTFITCWKNVPDNGC